MTMLKYIKHSFKLKLFLPLAILYIALVTSIYFILINSISQTLQIEFASKGKSIINSLATYTQETVLNSDVSTLQNYIDRYRDVDGISFIIILDENHNIIAHTFYPKVPDEYVKKIDSEKYFHIDKTNDDLVIDEEVINNKKELVLSRPILNGLVGHIYMGMGIERRQKEIIAPLMRTIIIILFIGALIAIIFSGFLINIAFRPILKLTEITVNYTNGFQYQYEELPEASEDEVGKLTKSFYQMMNKTIENKKWLEQEVKNRTNIINEQQMTLINASKMSSLGEMAGGIAHEINTPLAIIGMNVEQINENIVDGNLNPEELQELVNVISSTTNRIAQIINGLRFFARDGSQLPMNKTNLDTILKETFNICSERMAAHGIDLQISKANTDGLYLECRAVEISQVLINLLNNAKDAVAECSDKFIQVQIRDLENEIEISVIDSGPGVPFELQEKIMQPFFTTKEIGKGTGLGLSISRGIIDSHKGQFYIDNNFPFTKFTVILPKVLRENYVGGHHG